MLATPSQVGMYRLEGNGTDSSGKGNNGTIFQAVAIDPALMGAGYNFDGINDHVSVPADATINNIVEKTMCCWVRVSELEDSSQMMSKRTAPGNGWVWGYDRLEAMLLFVTFSGTNLNMRTAIDTIPKDVWNHVACVYKNDSVANVPKFYVNGVEKAIDNLVGNHSIPTGTVDSDAGEAMKLAGDNNPKDGDLDEESWYNTDIGLPNIKRVMLGMHPLV